MKKRFFLSATLIIAFCALIFSGCFLKDDDEDDAAPAVAAAEEVTIAQVTALGVTPTGTGTAPSTKAEVTSAVDTIGSAEEEISDALEGVITVTKANFKKSIKASLVAKVAKAVKADDEGEDDDDDDDDDDRPASGSWNQSGTFNLVDSGYFTTGTAEYSTSGSWADTDTFAQVGTSTVYQGAETESDNYSFKYKITDAKMRYKDITLNGFVNENSNENESFSASVETQGTESEDDDAFKSLSSSIGMNLSYRSDYSINDSVVCYIVVSMDFSVAVNKQFTEAELAGITEDGIDAAIMNAMTKSGGMTVKIFNAAGAEVYSESYTADELWTNFFGKDDEEDNNDEGDSEDEGSK